jgi:hypothetical protein
MMRLPGAGQPHRLWSKCGLARPRPGKRKRESLENLRAPQVVRFYRKALVTPIRPNNTGEPAPPAQTTQLVLALCAVDRPG